jgi:hypothetical protein
VKISTGNSEPREDYHVRYATSARSRCQFALVCAALPASAQETVRIRGTIEAIEGPVYVVKTRDGAEVKVTVTDNPLFVAIVKSTMADIKPGMFVGSTGMTQPDGSQKAIEVHIFPESMRGTGEGHYDWDLKPNTKMTNANVEQTVAGVDGPVLSVKYKDGEKKLLVTPGDRGRHLRHRQTRTTSSRASRFSSAPPRSSLTAPCKPRASPTARTG